MRILPDKLPKLSGIAQCVDAQWAPPDVLAQAARDKLPVASFVDRLREATKAEFFKSLLLLQSVVVNRSYLLENPTLRQMYIARSPTSEAFEALMEAGAIVPFLTDENSLSEYKLSDIPDDVKSFWNNAESANAVQRLRLSWDDAANKAKLQAHISRRFSDFFKTVDDLDAAKLKSDFALGRYDDEQVKQLLISLRDFTNKISDTKKRLVSRTDIYNEFVCVEGSDDFRIDGDKPLALPIKALADLKYNVNLPDALNRYIVTSQGSIGRDSLQEIRALTEGVQSLDDHELTTLLESIARLGLDVAARTAELTDVHNVKLEDVVAVRADPVWQIHNEISIENLPDASKPFKDQAFVKDPLKSVTSISTSLGNLVERLSQKVDDRRMEEVEQRCEVVVQAVGAFEMVATKIGTHIFGLPEVGVDAPTKRPLEQMMVPLLAHAVVSWKGNGISYEIKQPIFQGKVWAESAQNIARELRERLIMKDIAVGQAEFQTGGIEVKDKDD